MNYYLVYGDESRLEVAPSAEPANTLFNTVSGRIRVGPDVLFGHNVCLLTGTHDYDQLGHARKQATLDASNDITIEQGVWLASNVTVIGPATIGRHAVVAAGAVVRGDVAPFSIVAGVPAKPVGTTAHNSRRGS